MLSYFFKCKKDTQTPPPPKDTKTSNGKTMLLSKSAVCNGKKLRFIKEQEAGGLLSMLEIKTPLKKIPLLGDILF